MVTVRRATLLDKSAIESVYERTVGASFALREDEWRRWFDSEGIVVAEENHQLIGFGGIDVSANEQVRWIYLLPEFQRAGLGSTILNELENIAWSSGLPFIRLHATPSAVEFYLKHGYTPVSDLEQFGHDHDGVEMVKRR